MQQPHSSKTGDRLVRIEFRHGPEKAPLSGASYVYTFTEPKHRSGTRVNVERSTIAPNLARVEGTTAARAGEAAPFFLMFPMSRCCSWRARSKGRARPDARAAALHVRP
jgi:hypothetical protein